MASLFRHRFVSTLLYVGIWIGTANHLSAAELPNIVIFISDDLGRLETSVYGSSEVKTSAMDKLASVGMTFNNAYVTLPSCCPNRLSLLIGLMPTRHGAHPNHSQPKPGTRFLMPILQRMGYYIASFGKIAHGRVGFQGCDFNSLQSRSMHKNIVKHFAENNIEGPICLLVGDRRPHVAWSKESIYDPNTLTLPSHFIDTPETCDHWARYLRDITGMDEEMGRVYNFAQEKFDENFIFLFTSDHGGQWPHGKWNLYDSGTRIPLIVSWPEHIDAGVRNDALVSWVDLIPTLIDLVGGDVPNAIDGTSFANVLLQNKSMHRDKIFTTHTGDGAMNIFPIRSVRIGQYKYIHNLRPDCYHTNHSDRHRKDGAGAFWDSWDEAVKTDMRAAATLKAYYTRPEYELFDLQSDPHELKNLVGDPRLADKLSQLKSELTAWTKRQKDDLKPHRQPYLISQPLPDLAAKPKKKQ